MKGFILINSLEGNTTAKIETNIYIKENETIEKFKDRIKKLKIYNEELILEELYNFIRFSQQLRNVLNEDKETNFKYYKQIKEKEKELENYKYEYAKLNRMFTEQAMANAKLINKEEN